MLINPSKNKTIVLNANEGFVLTLEGQKPLQHKKSKYNTQMIAAIKEACKFNHLDNIVFDDIGRKLNKNESTFLKDELTATIAESMETWYPNNTARTIFVVNSMALPAAQTLKYSMREWNGKARVATEESTEMPLIGRSKKSYPAEVYELQLGAQYTLQELEAAAMGQQPLNKDIITDLRKGHERAFNDNAFGIGHLGDDGDPNAEDIPGLFNQLDRCITSSDTSDLNNHNILDGSATDNKNFLLKVINTPHNFTEQAEAIPDTLVMPIAQVNVIMTQTLSADNNDTVASFILNKTSIKRIIASPECKNVGYNSLVDVLFVFNASELSGICAIQETMAYRSYPAQLKDFTYKIPTRSRNAGLFIFRKAIALVKNCGNTP